MQQSSNQIVRRPKAAISSYSTNVVHLRNPLVVAWWSLVYPGFGHFRLVSTINGIFLFMGELLINTHAHLNMAILYSFIGNFAMAIEVLDIHLLLLYCGILVFAVWDSHRVAVEINKFSVLADHENTPITPMALTSAGLNSLEKRNPWVAAAWAALMPGVGHLYCVAIAQAVFLIIVGAIIIYFSHFLPAIYYTAIGQFALAEAVIDWQWLLNVPSFYCFSIYDAYVKTVELNKLFDQEQVQFLRNNYQNPLFPMPV
ncbi:MAG: hypothetical protein ABFD08_18115 [Syntrophomonas sp.]